MVGLLLILLAMNQHVHHRFVESIIWQHSKQSPMVTHLANSHYSNSHHSNSHHSNNHLHQVSWRHFSPGIYWTSANRYEGGWDSPCFRENWQNLCPPYDNGARSAGYQSVCVDFITLTSVIYSVHRKSQVSNVTACAISLSLSLPVLLWFCVTHIAFYLIKCAL